MKELKVEPYNYPIQFKELNHSDFEGYNFENENKTIIEPDENGYISKELNEIIDLKKKDTTVINASVGQGKTTAIIDFVNWYYQENEKGNRCKVIIVTPFKSLNKEYASKIIKESELDNIFFDYQQFDEGEVRKEHYIEFYTKPIQLISVKSIMGDGGSVAHKQSDIKREYYEFLIENCKRNNEKVILIFDEIHESLDSFNPKLLPNLFKWQGVVHKIIVASATFNEASKVAIKYLANLTEKNICIIESKRVQQLDRLSELHLCFYNQFVYKENDQHLNDLIEEQAQTASTINILCFSSNLAKSIYTSNIGTILKNKFGDVKLCTGITKNYFDKDSCNIGTNFKTGISIEKKDSAYFVILPLRFAYSDTNKEPFGIFTDRINSLIQALARPRNNSKIFVIVPSPEKLIITPGADNLYIKRLSLDYLKFDEEQNQTKYLLLKNQNSILKQFYDKNRSHIEESIETVANLDASITTQFPPFESFKLLEGERFLYSQNDSYGKNLSNYMYWAAWNNQFVNCKLTSIIKVSTYKFSEGNVQYMLDQYFAESFYSDAFFTLNSDKDCYYKIRNTLFSNNLFYKKHGQDNYETIGPYRNSNFEQQLITFIQRKKIDFNFEFRKLVYPTDGEFYYYKNGKKSSINKIPVDVNPTKESYIRNCMAHSQNVIESISHLVGKELQIIISYSNLYKYRDILLNDYVIRDNKGNELLLTDTNFKFRNNHSKELLFIFETLLNNDEVLKSFSTKKLNKDKSIYRLLRSLFFKTSLTTKIIDGKSGKYLRIKSNIPLPNPSDYINLICNVQDAWINQSGNGIVESEFSNDPNWKI